MKLTQFEPQTAAGITGYRQADPGRYVAGEGAVAGALARGTAGLDTAAARALDLRQQAEAAKDRVAAETDAAELMARFEVEHAALDKALRNSTSDDKAYLESYREGVQSLREKYDQQATPGARAVFARRMPSFLAGKDVEAQGHADAMWKGARAASLVRTNDALETLAGSLDPGDDAGYAQLLATSDAAIAAQAPILGPKATAETQIRQRDRITNERATRDALTSPDAFLDRLAKGDTYAQLDPANRDRLVTRAQTVIRQSTEDIRKNEERAKKQASDAAESEATLLWMDRKLTVEVAKRNVANGTWDAGTGRTYEALAQKVASLALPINPALERQFALDATDPTKNPREVAARMRHAIAAEQIGYTQDIQSAFVHVDGRIRTLDDRAESRQQAELNRARSAADAAALRQQNAQLAHENQQVTHWHGQLKWDLQTQGTLAAAAKFDTTDRAVQSRALVEYGERTARGEPADKVYKDVVLRALPQLRGAVDAQRRAIRNTLGPYQTQTQINAARANGAIKQPEWEQLTRASRDLELLNQASERYAGSQQAVEEMLRRDATR